MPIFIKFIQWHHWSKISNWKPEIYHRRICEKRKDRSRIFSVFLFEFFLGNFQTCVFCISLVDSFHRFCPCFSSILDRISFSLRTELGGKKDKKCGKERIWKGLGHPSAITLSRYFYERFEKSSFEKHQSRHISETSKTG